MHPAILNREARVSMRRHCPVPDRVHRTRSFAACLVLLAGLILAACPPAQPDTSRTAPSDVQRAALTAAGARDTLTELELRFLDVGQGDAVLIRSWEVTAGERLPGRVALIDAGPVNRVVAQLRALGVEAIDLMIASHNHLDHIGGMDAILDSLPVRFYLDNGHPATTRIQRRVLERVESKGVTYLQSTRRSIALGSAQLHVVPPPDGVPGDEQNNRSLTVVLEHGRFRALFTGDAEVQLLNALLASGDIPTVDVLKASHHGSRNGVTPGLLAQARPRIVVVSVGAGNQYGHPHPAAMRYFCSGGRRVFRTDQVGDVVLDIDATGAHALRFEPAGTSPVPELDACLAHSPSAAEPEEPGAPDNR
jgi:competence protein ComEC